MFASGVTQRYRCLKSVVACSLLMLGITCTKYKCPPVPFSVYKTPPLFDRPVITESARVSYGMLIHIIDASTQ